MPVRWGSGVAAWVGPETSTTGVVCTASGVNKVRVELVWPWEAERKSIPRRSPRIGGS
jgi:hypothetical protein